MSWTLLSAVAVMVAGISDAQAAPRASGYAVRPDRISYVGTGNGWIGGVTEWWIDGSGHGSYRSTMRIEEEGSFDAGPEGFERISATLQQLEQLSELPCDGAVTDQGAGVLNWQRGHRTHSLRFDFGCRFRQPDAARSWLSRASGMVREWALAKRQPG